VSIHNNCDCEHVTVNVTVAVTVSVSVMELLGWLLESTVAVSSGEHPQPATAFADHAGEGARPRLRQGVGNLGQHAAVPPHSAHSNTLQLHH
jgi:hypothetical protein